MKTLIIPGSLRKDSYNRKLLAIASDIAQGLGCEIKKADLKDLDFPVLNEDEQPSKGEEEFNDLVAEAKLIIIATPEYNRSIPGGLKNALDHINGKIPLADKVAVIIGASTSGFGTVRAQRHLRQVLAPMGALMLHNPEIHVNHAKDAFNEDGSLKDETIKENLKLLIEKSIDLARKI